MVITAAIVPTLLHQLIQNEIASYITQQTPTTSSRWVWSSSKVDVDFSQESGQVTA